MKKWIALVLCLLLTPCAAMAAGLSGLTGTANTGISGLMDTGMSAALPDPAAALGSTGTLFREHYEFVQGHFFTVYSYANPVSESKFINEYSALAQKAAYTVTASQIPEMEGLSGFSVQRGDGKTAYLAINVQGQMLFMVEEGMDYVQQTRTNYIAFDFMGEHIDLSGVYTSKSEMLGYYIHSDEDVGRTGFSDFKLTFPLTANTGKSYYVTKEAFIDDFSIEMKNAKHRKVDFISPYTDSDFSIGVRIKTRADLIFDDKDFAYLSIDSLEETGDSIRVKGTLEGRFQKGDFEIKNGVFDFTFMK